MMHLGDVILLNHLHPALNVIKSNCAYRGKLEFLCIVHCAGDNWVTPRTDSGRLLMSYPLQSPREQPT